MTSELDEVLDTLEDVINQACYSSDGLLDSMALRAYATAMRVLSDHGRFTIEAEHGRRVIGRLTGEGRP